MRNDNKDKHKSFIQKEEPEESILTIFNRSSKYFYRIRNVFC